MGELMDKLGRELGQEEKQSPSTRVISGPDVVEAAFVRGQALQAFQKGLGMDSNHHPPPKAEEKETTKIDVAAMMASMVEVAKTMMAAVKENKPESAENPYLKHLEGELKAIKDKYDAGPPDPLTFITETQEKMDKLVQSMKQRLGIGERVSVNTENYAYLIELEKLKGEREERGLQWQAEMEQRRQEFEVRMQEMDEERRFKWANFNQGREVKSGALRELTNLASSVVENLGLEGTETRSVGSTVLPCPTCGGRLKVKAGAEKVKCLTCGDVHELKWGKASQKMEEKTPATVASPLVPKPEEQPEDED